jgi:hypothetical protein
MDRPHSTEIDTTLPEHARPSLHIDDLFIAEFQGLLNTDQLDALSRYTGLEVNTSSDDSAITHEFTFSLRQKLRHHPRTARIANSCDAQTQIADETGESSTLVNLGLNLVVQDIKDSIDEIKANAPLEKIGRKNSIMRKALRYLRPDLWEEAQVRYAQDDAEYEIEEKFKRHTRESHFNKVCGILEDLSGNPGAVIADRVPMATLIQMAEITTQAKPSTTVNGASRTSTSSRLERLSSYQKPVNVSLSPETAQGAPLESTQLQNEPLPSEAIAQPQGIQVFEFPWLSSQPVELDVVRYSQAIHIDLVCALSGPLDKLARDIDRNPINSHGLDKYEAVIEHLAKRIASGVMPWESSNSVKRQKSKVRADKSYPDTIWYTFDRSPNAPRVYFTLGPEEAIANDARPCRKLIILAETDKSHQTDVLSEFTGLSVQRLRAHGAGAK